MSLLDCTSLSLRTQQIQGQKCHCPSVVAASRAQIARGAQVKLLSVPVPLRCMRFKTEISPLDGPFPQNVGPKDEGMNVCKRNNHRFNSFRICLPEHFFLRGNQLEDIECKDAQSARSFDFVSSLANPSCSVALKRGQVP